MMTSDWETTRRTGYLLRYIYGFVRRAHTARKTKEQTSTLQI